MSDSSTSATSAETEPESPTNNAIGSHVTLDETSWWTVDRSRDPKLTRGATPLFERCMRCYMWSEAHTLKVLAGYKKFLQLKKNLNDFDAKILSPSLPVDQMWHQHILDTRNYEQDCVLLCGRVVHHDPDGMLDAEARRRRVETTKHILESQVGELDEEVWFFGREEPNDSDSSRKRARTEERDGLARLDEAIVIRVRDSNFEDTLFKIKPDTPMGRIFTVYANRKELSIATLAFLLDGQRICGEQTPRQLELVDGDIIDCTLEATGC